MSLTGTLSTALSGLNVAQASINAVSHNIVNANTEGYVRKTVSQSAVILQDRGAGVEVGVAERLADEFLVEEARRQATITGRSLVLDKYHGLTQDAFGNPASGNDISNLVGDLAATIEAFATDHQTGVFARDVLVGAKDVTDTISRLSDTVQSLRGEADQEIGRVVDEINSYIDTIHDLNAEIARVQNSGDVNPELFDKRDLAVKQLSEKIEINIYTQGDGIIALYTSRGESLLDSSKRVMHYNPVNSMAPDSTLPALSIFRTDQIDPSTDDPYDVNAGIEVVSSGVRATLTPELLNDATPDASQQIVSLLKGGEIEGLIEIRDQVLPNLNDQLQELADGLRFAINKGHNDAVPWPQPTALSGTRTDLSSFAGATRNGTATIAVIEASDGSTAQAFQIDLGAVVDETDLVNQINTNLGALGTASIGSDGQLEISLASAAQGLAISEGDSSITVADAAGRDRDYGFSHYFGLNDFLVVDGPLPTDFVIRPDIASDPARIGTAKLDVTTAPLTATLGGVGDNRGAKGLLDAFNGSYEVLARGGLPAKSVDFGSYAAEIIAVTANNAHQAEDQARVDRALSEAVNFRNDSKSSVNLDEELAALMTLQQAYSVAARLMSTVNEMLDELVDVMRR